MAGQLKHFLPEQKIVNEQKLHIMNTKSNEAGQPEQKPNSELQNSAIPSPPAIGNTNVSTSTGWELIAHSHQIADTGDYDGCYEITNGKISIFTKDDDDEALQPIVDALNDSGCKFYQDDWLQFENGILKDEIKRLTFMIDNGLGWKDMVNDIPPVHGL